jgi:uncharacterized protein (TIGR02594 family)
MISEAMRHYGKNRLYHREWLKEIFSTCGYTYPIESNWCAIFMHYVAIKSGYRFPLKAETARAWLTTGVPTCNPSTGDLAVFWRDTPQSWKGHVGLYIGKGYDDQLYILGGNQGKTRSVVVSLYPISRLIGYRKVRQNGKTQ